MSRLRIPMGTLAFLTLAATSFLACNSTSLEPVDTTESLITQSVQAPLVVEGCTALEVEVSGRDRIQVREAGSCSEGLQLALEGEPTFDRRDDGRVELPLAVVNASDADVALPVRVILPPDSIEVLHPPGFGQNGLTGVTPENPDSVLESDSEFQGAALWRVGSGEVLPSGEASNPAILAFGAHDGVRRFRLGFVVRGQVADTSRPEIPENTFSFPDDTTAYPLTPPDSAGRYYRTVVGVLFRADAGGPAIRDFLSRFDAEIIAGTENIGAYILRLPDPGKSEEAWLELLDRMKEQSSVDLAFPIAYSTNTIPNTRYPEDGPGMRRSDWIGGTTETWALRATRSPLAWGCATGTYSEAEVRMGIVDYLFDEAHPELRQSVARSIPPDAARLRPDPNLASDETSGCSRADPSYALAGGGSPPRPGTATPGDGDQRRGRVAGRCRGAVHPSRGCPRVRRGFPLGGPYAGRWIIPDLAPR